MAGQVDIVGKRDEIVKVTLDPSLLRKYELDVADVYGALRKYNNIVPAGTLVSDDANYSIKIPGLYENYREIGELPIKMDKGFILKLDDITEIKRTYDDKKNIVIVNGKTALNMQISRKAGTNIIDTYNSGSKVATIKKDSDATAGFDHIVAGTTIVSPDSTSVYQIEPAIKFTGPTDSNSAHTLSSSNNWSDTLFYTISNENHTSIEFISEAKWDIHAIRVFSSPSNFSIQLKH